MPRRKTSKIAWAFLILILSGFIWLAWTFFFLHVDDPGIPVSIARATAFASIPIPPDAINIRIAGYHHAVQFEQYVRFEAPTSSCLQTAAKILPDAPLQPIPSSSMPPQLMPVRSDVLRDLSWFDLHKATNVVGIGGGQSQPAIWIDQDRGVFYYRMTD